jgi:hypothetical protein
LIDLARDVSGALMTGFQIGGFTRSRIRSSGLFADFPTADLVTVRSLGLKELG